MSKGPDNPYEPPRAVGPPTGTSGTGAYDSLPWYRKSSILSIFVLLGLCCGPSILFVCIVVLTGDVYYNKLDDSGNLKRWGVANKVAAVVLLVFNVVATAFQVYMQIKAKA